MRSPEFLSTLQIFKEFAEFHISNEDVVDNPFS